MFKNKKVLVTGGTGTLGSALVLRLLDTDVETIRIFSRDELKQSQMQSELKDPRLRFIIGDIRDKERLSRALEDINIVFHCAALKQVPVAEYNPFEAVKTNVYGSQNLIEVCLDRNIEIAVAIGTDKAVAPLNTYGATKLLMERLFISANHYKGKNKIKFICVRYGNVLGSRGSLVPIIVNKIKKNQDITITDPEMTRFNITLNQALDLVLRAAELGKGGEVFIPKLKAYKVDIVKNAILEIMNSSNKVERIPVRPGEKIHEVLISKDEARCAYESDKDYVIVENGYDVNLLNLKKSKLESEYSSDKVELLTKDEIKEILLSENLVT